MKTKVHRVVLLIIDHDNLGANGVREVIENANYPNDCIGPHVMESDTVEVEWTDDHPLNKRTTMAETFATMWPESGSGMT